MVFAGKSLDGGRHMIPEQLRNAGFVLLRKEEKIPFEKNWQNNPRTYPEAIKHLKRNGNVGILCGDGLAVVDCDNPDLVEICTKQLPETLTIQTGSGGHHFYFNVTLDKKYVLTKGKNHLGEVQYTGSQVVCPPSIHPNGEPYTVVLDKPISTIDTDTFMKIISPYTSEISFIEDDKQIKDTDKTKSGKEFGIVCKLIKKGFSKEKVFDEMGVYKKWSDSPVAYREYTYKKALQTITQPNLTLPNQPNHNTREITVYSLRKDIEEGVPEMNWIVRDIVPERGITIIGSPPKNYKTFVAMHMALCCATGKDFLSQYTTQKQNVLYVDEENGRATLLRRFEELQKGMKLDKIPENIKYTSMEGLKLDITELSSLSDVIKELDAKVVVLDSLVRFMVGDENNASEVRKVFATLSRIMEETGCSFVILHHFRKGSHGKNEMDSLRGSGDFVAMADVIITLYARLYEGKTNLTFVANRHKDMRELQNSVFTVESDVNGLVLEWESYLEDLPADEGAVAVFYKWLMDEDIKEFTTKNGKQILKNKGYTANQTYYDVIDQLYKERKIKKIKNGLYEVVKKSTENFGGFK